MGNTLVAYAPSLIRPVEYYLTDIPELNFDANLGSTRFLKVCRAKQGPILWVVKVFVIHEHTVPIQAYCERLMNLKHCLSSTPSPNCLPFTKTISTEKSVIAIRPYVKFSLYDRMSTRPFIQWPEKLWIAFQLLCGLTQIHKHGLCHGDLKLENILITPGLRLLLCDFAPYKPVYLPRNNPSAIFGFFFDTAGRRCCYVAPERFHDDKSRLGADNLLTQEDELKHFLLPSMDIFSAGCCLIELFTEGRVPFDLSQLLLFCSFEYDPSPVLQQIEDLNARELVTHMIQRDFTMRASAEEYLTRFRGLLFPEVLYSTLQSYFDILAFQPLMKPDSRMVRLWQDIRNLPKDTTLGLIFTSLVTAEVRGLQSITAKLYALDSFRVLFDKLTDESILERVVPYVTFLLEDPTSPRVRAEALTTLVDCLDYVKEVPPSDYNIFSGFIFPAIEKLDRDVAVRISLARNVARIARISMRYLEASFLNDPERLDQHHPQFVSELHSQRDAIAGFLSNLLTDNDAVVKRALVSTPGSLESLCTYFGPTKAHDILLSHLITFLNDKDDVHLRMAFFQCVPSVASFIGSHAAPLIIPLIKQGLSDVEEFVMREGLLTIKSLAEINFFRQRFLLDLLEEVLPFVIHPNLWLRHASVGVITSIKTNLSDVDVHCHIIPKLKAYLKPSFGSLYGVNEISVLSKVISPLDRQVYESCARAKGSLLSSAIEYLRNTNWKSGEPESPEIINFIIRLKAEGLPIPLDPVYTSFLQKHIMKVNTQRCLRNTSSEISTFPAQSANKTNYSSFQQQPLQSHLLIMTTPPIKEFDYRASISSFSANDGLPSCIPGAGPMITRTFSGTNYGLPLTSPQHHAFFSEKPRGVLVAHLAEHSSSVIKITPLTTFKGLFATASRDDVRIWDAEKIEGRNVANRSRCNIRLPGEKIVNNICYAAGANIIGVADDQTLYGFSVENMVARCVFSLPIGSIDEPLGIPIGLESFSPYLIIIGTELGALLGYDTRIATKEIFKYNCELKRGLLTALCSDEGQSWMCTGTSKGFLNCWDLRFGISVNTIKTDFPVRRMKPSPFHPWGVFTSCRSINELSLWNLETGNRHISLWGSSLPPLTKPPDTSIPFRSTTSIHGIAFSTNHNAVITAGSDFCVRWWDIDQPTESFTLISPEKLEQQLTNSALSKTSEYRFRLVDGVEVLHDVGVNSSSQASFPGGWNKKSEGDGSMASSAKLPNAMAYSIMMGHAHHNVITDLSTVATPNQSFILSGSSDGVVKVWK